MLGPQRADRAAAGGPGRLRARGGVSGIGCPRRAVRPAPRPGVGSQSAARYSATCRARERVRIGRAEAAAKRTGKRPARASTTAAPVATKVKHRWLSLLYSKLRKLIDELYKGAKTDNPVGTGSTADAIRHEIATREPVGGKWHAQKGLDYINALGRWLRRSPQASASDRAVAQQTIADLDSALMGR
jgi:hypothetical protein